MAKQLEGQVALVTGAGRGIGRAISLALGTAGAHVVVAARTRPEIEAVAGRHRPNSHVPALPLRPRRH